ALRLSGTTSSIVFPVHRGALRFPRFPFRNGDLHGLTAVSARPERQPDGCRGDASTIGSQLAGRNPVHSPVAGCRPGAAELKSGLAIVIYLIAQNTYNRMYSIMTSKDVYVRTAICFSASELLEGNRQLPGQRHSHGTTLGENGAAGTPAG